jgi:enoyl-CoA hydratase
MVRIEKQGAVWTVIHSRFAEARNAMDPDSADALAAALREFDADESASVAVLWGEGGAFCAGWDLKFASTLSDRDAFQRHVADGLAFPTGANPAVEAIFKEGAAGAARFAAGRGRHGDFAKI